jgi:hypothetical protein
MFEGPMDVMILYSICAIGKHSAVCQQRRNPSEVKITDGLSSGKYFGSSWRSIFEVGLS